jgi:hypothetical protein
LPFIPAEETSEADALAVLKRSELSLLQEIAKNARDVAAAADRRRNAQ